MPANANTSVGPSTPKIVARDVLQALTRKFPILASIATGFSEKPLKKGQTAQIKITKELSAQTFNGTYENQGLDYDLVDVVINRHEHVSIATTEGERVTNDGNVYQENVDNAAHALGKAASDYLLGLITVANFPTEFVKTAANSNYTVLTDANSELRTLKAPTRGRFGIMSGPVWDEFSDDERTVSRDYRTGGPDYREDMISEIKGYDRVFAYEDLPTAENLIGFYGTRRALAFASTIPTKPEEYFDKLGNAGGILDVVTDPQSRLQMMYRYWYNWSNGDLQMDLTWLYGGKLLDGSCGVRQVSAANP